MTATPARCAKNYRRSPSTRTWHFVPACAQWPDEEYEDALLMPLDGLLCVECLEHAQGTMAEFAPARPLA